MTYHDNVKAVLECYFTGFKEEIIDSACVRICSIDQEPCTDAVSRQAVLDALHEADMNAYDEKSLLNGIREAVNVLPSVNFQPCDDAISRQDAIDAIYEHEFSNWCDKDEVSTILNDSPSVTQKSETVTEFADRCRECEAYRAGVKYVVDKLRGRLYYVPGGWKKASPENRMIFDSLERALDECAENAQIGGEE